VRAGSEENTMPEMKQTEGQDAPETEMCCDGEKTAEQHRHESSDGKCCIDK
jgi:hypothetical protein